MTPNEEEVLAELFGQLSALREMIVVALVESVGWAPDDLNGIKTKLLDQVRYRAEAAPGAIDPLKIQAAALRAIEELCSKAVLAAEQMGDPGD